MKEKARIAQIELMRMAEVVRNLGVPIELVTYDGVKVSASPFLPPEPSQPPEKEEKL